MHKLNNKYVHYIAMLHSLCTLSNYNTLNIDIMKLNLLPNLHCTI